METSSNHLTSEVLEQGLDEVLRSPRDSGPLEAIFLRPQENERQTVTTAQLSPEGGIEGDRWVTNHWMTLPDGSSDPTSQVSLMNSRVLRLVAGNDDSMQLAGDNLIVDLDLSEANFPIGCRLKIGEEVVLEFTAQAHTGCGKFARRYGVPALEFVNGPTGKPLNFRGRYATINQGGTIQIGDLAVKTGQLSNRF